MLLLAALGLGIAKGSALDAYSTQRHPEAVADFIKIAQAFGLSHTQPNSKNTKNTKQNSANTTTATKSITTQIIAKTKESTASYVSPEGQITLSETDRILFAGDSLMQGVAPHIAAMLKKQYGITSIDLSKQSTGLAYPKFFDWPATIEKAIEKSQSAAQTNTQTAGKTTEKITVLMMFIGANDPWDMRLDGAKFEKFYSENWQAAYTERVERIITRAHAANVKVVWVMMPPMQHDRLSLGAPKLNALYLAACQKTSARCVDTGATLSDTPNVYNAYKTNALGKRVEVRRGDGVHFTTAGHILLAQDALSVFSFVANVNAKVKDNVKAKK